MKYDITVRSGSTPGEGSVLYTQSGTFGADGTDAYAGYRTLLINGKIAGDVQWQKGAHDKDLSASMMLRRVW